MDILTSIFNYLLSHFTGFTERTHWVFLLTAVLLAFGVYVGNAKQDWSIKGAAQFIFPKDVWWHKSSRLDYAYFAVNAFIMLLIFTPLIGFAYPAVVELGMNTLTALNVPTFNGPPIGVAALYFICVILMTDFMIFLAHYLQHKVSFLWQFHKVHHAAEVLNPMTLYRQHPMDFVLTGILAGGGAALIHSIFSYTFSEPFSLFALGGLNVVALMFYLLGYNLRHSHIRLSFGKIADRYFISPEQHQLHHSCVEAHFDKNMGLIFAVWDRLFKTHYIPARDEDIVLGLPDGEAKEFNSVLKLYFLPFKKAFNSHKFTLSALIFAGAGISTAAIAVGQYTPASLFLEEMTWTEIDEAKNKGFTSIIIPTGGTEQNGPHVILGKHNKIIQHTAQEIAQRHGNTLIAPVVTYVPEGSIAPKTGHMQYTGTISIREEAFEMILEDTAKSLYAHGFKNIYIIGDSGDSVAAQTRAAERIQKDVKAGQTVLHVTDYYQSNGQVEHLLEEGFTRKAIGWHAGLRDTSELIAVAPEGVRDEERLKAEQRKGANGAFWRANEDIGQKMLALKVEAAVKQMALSSQGRAEIE
jgi:sterol desaturase/sphingolipid hydroxylase (fatty acid hydroxylase superfamily)/creatinine amidohydrolase/Fe(II)-dependent formamide hydrolase-like protein